jgi:phosphoenolpyruvate carboxykinase (ATP)
MKIAHTRAMVTAILDGSLREAPTEPDPVFGIHVPTACPGVPAEVLRPRNTWADTAAYDDKARDLARQFVENFKQFAGHTTSEVTHAGPRL